MNRATARVTAAALLLLPGLLAVPPDPGPAVVLLGAGGSFGALQDAHATPTDQGFAVHAVPGWGFAPGQAAWFTVAAADGSVLVANLPQNDNPVTPTARTMTVSAYYPAQDAFANVDISTATAAADLGITTPGAGADIEDLQLLPNGDVAFDSASPWSGWDASQYGVFPSYGVLRQTGGVWGQVPGPVGKRTGLSIQASNALLGPDACPTAFGGGTIHSSCRGPAEMALLPGSQNLVMTQYFPSSTKGPVGTSGRLMVVDQSGTLLATYAYPDVPDSSADPRFQPKGYGCAPDNANLEVSPREVVSDPTSAFGDERFAVVFDTWHCPNPFTGERQSAPFMVQEFSYNAANRTITPVSKAVYPGGRSNLVDAADTMSVAHARYDDRGNLWVATIFSDEPLVGSGLYVYPKGRWGRQLTANPLCAWNPLLPVASQWWIQCDPPGIALGDVGVYGQPMDLVQDPKSHAMIMVTSGHNSVYLLIVQFNGGRPAAPFTVKPPVDLGISRLHASKVPAAPPVGTGYQLVAQKGAVDYQPGVHDWLYVPVQGALAPGQAIPATPVAIPQYLARVDLDQVTE